MLEVSGLTVSVGDVALIGPRRFSVESGETFVIRGEGGAGESLVAQTITGSLPRDQKMERVMRIELTSPAWEAGVIPLYDTRLAFNPAVRSSGASSCRCKQPHHSVGLPAIVVDCTRLPLQLVSVSVLTPCSPVKPRFLLPGVIQLMTMSIGEDAAAIEKRHAATTTTGWTE